MNPDPTITVSLDYLIELSDDGNEPGGPEPEIVMPPSGSHRAESAPTPANPTGQGPQH